MTDLHYPDRSLFIESFTLPVAGLETVRDMILEAGGSIGGELSDDGLFIEAHLPNGWRKECGDRSSNTLIVDEAGRVRAEVELHRGAGEFVARIQAELEFAIRIDSRRALRNESVAVVYEYGREVHRTCPIVFAPRHSADRYLADNYSELSARRWLDHNHPLWRHGGGSPLLAADQTAVY